MFQQSEIYVFPKEIIADTIQKECTYSLRLFSQTAAFSRSQSYLILIKRYSEKNQQESLKNLLFDLYLNYEILTKKNTEALIPVWIKFLNNFRQKNDIPLINRLLATALLVLLDETRKDQLNYEFNILLHLLDEDNPQLANSILAQLAHIKEDKTLFDKCSKVHSLQKVLSKAYQKLTLNEVKILISPFKKEYSLSFVIDLKSKIYTLNEENYFNSIHAVLKIMPAPDSFWLEPLQSADYLKDHLLTANLSHREYISAIFLTFQARLADKNFLANYYKVIPKDQKAIIDAVNEAINHGIEDEELIINHLEEYYYPKLLNEQEPLPALFFSRMRRYLSRLEKEENIISEINKIFLYLRGIYANTMANILIDLLPKLNSPIFLANFICRLFESPFSFEALDSNRIEKLASICTFPQLNEETILACLDELNLYIKKSYGTTLCFKLMPSLCLGIISKKKIDFWLSQFLVNLKAIENDELEWFKNDKNFMYFECSLILLAKKEVTEVKEELIFYLDKLFWLYSNDQVCTKDSLDKLLDKILPYIKSKEIFSYLLSQLFWITKEHAFQHFPTVFLPIVNKKDMVSITKKLKVMMNYGFDSAYKEKLLECLSILVLKLPQEFSEILAKMLFANNTYGDSKNIRDYVTTKTDCNPKMSCR